MTFAAMMTVTTGTTNDVTKTNENGSDEMAAWNRIIQMRVKESEALGITTRLLNVYGNEAITGNIDVAVQAGDDVDTFVVVQRFLLQQLLRHHVDVLMKCNADTDSDTNVVNASEANVTGRTPTTHDRVLSWKLLRDIFKTIDEVKRLKRTNSNDIDHLFVDVAAAGSQMQHLETKIHAVTTDGNVDHVKRRPLSEMVRDKDMNRSNQSGTTKSKTTASGPQSTSVNGGNQAPKVKKNKTVNCGNELSLAKSKETTGTIPKKRKRPPAVPILVQKPQQQPNDGTLTALTITSKAKQKPDAAKRPPTVSKQLGTATSKIDKVSAKAKSASLKPSNGKKDATARETSTSIVLDVADVDRPIQKRVRPTIDDAQQKTNLTSLIPLEAEALPIRKKKTSKPMNPDSSDDIPLKKRKRKLITNSEKPRRIAEEDHAPNISATVFRNGTNTGINNTMLHLNDAGAEHSTSQYSNTIPNDKDYLPSTQNQSISRSNIPSNSHNHPIARMSSNQSGRHDQSNFSKPQQPNRNGSKVDPLLQSRTGPYAEMANAASKHAANPTNPAFNSSITITSHRPIDALPMESTGQPINDFDNEAVKESRHVLASSHHNGRKCWTCSLCGSTRIVHLARHCETERHRSLLLMHQRDNANGNTSSPYQFIYDNEAVRMSREASVIEFDRIDGNKAWKCILCNADGIRTLDLVDHCENSRHRSMMEEKARGHRNKDDIDSNSRGYGNAQYNNDPLTESQEFLLEYKDDEYSKVHWSCKLCDVQNIATINLSRHCETERHQLYLKIHRKKAQLRAKQQKEEDMGRSIERFTVEPNATKVWDDLGESQRKNLITFHVKSDTKNFASNCKARLESCIVKVDAADIPPEDVVSIGNRLQEWEPFWIIKSIVCVGITNCIKSVDPQVETIQTAAQHFIPGDLQTKYKCTSNYKTVWDFGDSVLLLRMLPKCWSTGKAKRADCHLWPKGTFLQVDDAPCKVEQRVQNPVPFDKYWKGHSKQLVCNELLSRKSERHCFQICCADTEPFYYVLSYCTYLSADQLYTNLIDQTKMGRLAHLTFEVSEDKAKEIASKQLTELIDSDNDDINDVEETGKFVFSLTCPISRQLMVTPVRGKDCKHFQCFDLRNFIDTNACVSHNRWRCASCENFVSLQCLQICGFTSHLLKEFKGSASSERDRVEFCSDGRYKLLEQQISRHKKRLESTTGSADFNIQEKPAAAKNIEIIDCD